MRSDATVPSPPLEEDEEDRGVRIPLHRRLLRAALAGACATAALFMLDFLDLSLDFMGFSDEKAISRVLHEYGPDVVRGQLALLAVMMSFGAAFGLLGGVLVQLRGRKQHMFIVGFASALLCHALLFARHLVRYPQLYSEAFYDHGGARRALMLALTRHYPPSLSWIIAVLTIGLLVPRSLYVPRVRRVPWRAIAPRIGIGAGVLLVVALVALHRGKPKLGRHPNVLLVAVDSLRADRVFGPDAQRFPTLSALAERSVRLRQAHVTVPRTFPSFVTLLTGRWPFHHGIRHMFPSQVERERVGTSLPRTLAEDGFRTAVLSDYAGEIFARTPIGFEEIDAPRFDMHTIVALRGLQVHPSALPYAAGIADRLFPFVRAMPERADPRLLADRAIDEIDRLAGGSEPFFLTVFFSTPHFPYASPYPYYQRFVDRAYEGPFLYDKPPLARAAVTPVDATHIQGLYDGAVAAVDDSLARVLAELRRTKIDDDTIVVLLADHGENLWDDPRAGMGHGDHLIGERADHVPLLIYDPRLAPRDVEAITRDVDLVPTLSTLLGIKAPPTDGVDLGPLLRGERADLGLAAFSETEYWFVPTGPGFASDERLPYPAVTGATDLAADGDVYMRPEIEPVVIAAKHRAIRLGDWKLTYRPTRNGVDLALYDTKHDPDEKLDVADEHADVVKLLRDRLYAWMLEDEGVVRRGDFVVPR